jgi:hypothetical protein
MKKIKKDQELRIYKMPIELRAGEGSRTIEGYACKFGVMSRDLGWFTEIIDKDAFSDIDLNSQDVKALFNHDSNLILARSNKDVDTLKLEIDATGLKYSFDAPTTSAGNDLLENVRLKNIQHSSFAFLVKVDQWEDKEGDLDVRTIMKFSELFDVSPVVDPAYLDTQVDVAKRSFDEYKKLTEKPDESIKNGFEQRKRIIRLNQQK